MKSMFMKPRAWFRSLPFVVLPLVLTAGLGAQEEDEVDPEELAEYLEKIDFEEFAESLTEEYCGRKATCSLDDILTKHFAWMDLGAYRVRYPGNSLGERKEVERLPVVLGCMIDLQLALAEWLAVDGKGLEQLKANGNRLRSWILEWETNDLDKVTRQEDKNLLTAMGADEDLIVAADAFRDAMRGGEVIGLALQLGDACEVILCPTRRDFIEIVSKAGLEDPEFRDMTWRKGLDQWTQCWRKWSLVLSLEYAPWDGFDSDFKRGMQMSRIDKDGLRMMTVQQAGLALLYNLIARPQPWHEEDGLSRNLVIAVCGGINTIDNERGITTAGGGSEPFEIFVPGGNPGGGVLSGIPAATANIIVENQWRKGHGEDHFVSNLVKGQRFGQKKASKDKDNPLRDDPLPHFLLEGDKGAKHVISAPFMGPHKNDNPYPPEEFMHDYRQFFQSYMTCFLNWLRDNGAEDVATSHVKYAELLKGMAGLRFSDANFDALVEATYGIPVSAKNGKTDNLEWRFLAWLQSQD